MNSSRALITGGAGFLGSHLCDRFLKEGWEVICMDNLITGDLRNIEHLTSNRRFSFHHQDVTEFIHVPGELDVVMHFASPASPLDYLELPIQTLKVGSLGTHKALGLACAKQARFLLASTSECYGDPLVHPQTEDYWGNVNPVGPRGVYDEAKRFAEAMTMAYHRFHGLDTRIVRIFNTYGPRMRLEDGRALPAFMSQALRGKPLSVFGDGSQTRSFCYVDDLIEGIWRLLHSDENMPTNIGNPSEMTILQFAELIRELTGSTSEIDFRELPEDDPKVRQPDITKARALLDWEPRVELRDGLERTLAYFRERLNMQSGAGAPRHPESAGGSSEMCGIVGAISSSAAILEGLVEGLRTLEYRGYDSCGVAVADGSSVTIRRKVGRLSRLEEALADGALAGATLGVGHTRWATHGKPSDENAHPHTDGSGNLALVHNGIIENYMELRRELQAEGRVFQSETDTEVLVHLVGRELETGVGLAEAVRGALARVQGYYAMAALYTGKGRQLVCARQGPPLVVASTEQGSWLASDVLAILPHTRSVVYLEDGDVAELVPGEVTLTTITGEPVERATRFIDWDAEAASKGGFEHHMLKEIHEQPDVLARTAFDRILSVEGDVAFEDGDWDPERLKAIERVQVVACGTALHAGFIARYMIEGLAGIPVDLDYASEFRYRTPRLVPNTVALAVSQSGETADTLAAMRLARELGSWVISICNVKGSTVARESEAVIQTHAGPEIGVASTKAFVAQVVASFLLAVKLGRARGALDRQAGRDLLDELRRLRPHMEQLLRAETVQAIGEVARRHVEAKGFFFLGRGINYPVALEGALKLKEISYVHAEGYAAGEMKHGPIALIEPGMPVVVVNSPGVVADKVRSNIEQVRARGGHVIFVGSDSESLVLADEAIEVPACGEWLSPILNVIPLQVFAYHHALARGCDIDKPHNLAKSVTVE